MKYFKVENNVITQIVDISLGQVTGGDLDLWFLLENIPARAWRDWELQSTDFWVPTTDHPQYSDRMTYRAALRNWPSTSDFPGTKPTL